MVACWRIFPERAVVAALPLYPLMAIESAKVSAVAKGFLSRHRFASTRRQTVAFVS
jgi:hypothetical protein